MVNHLLAYPVTPVVSLRFILALRSLSWAGSLCFVFALWAEMTGVSSDVSVVS